MVVKKIVISACILLLCGGVSLDAKEAVAKSDLNTSVQEQKSEQVEAWENVKEDENQKVLIGSQEKLRIIPGNVMLEARIDTGAETTSIGVTDLQIIKEDGVDWAIFKIGEVDFKQKVVDYTRIKRHGTVSTKRAVIKLRLILGNVSQIVNVTLADRSKFEFKLLIGRNMLYDRFIVDVSKQYTCEPMEYKE